jgi:molybdate transport system regulatory protein
MENDGHRLRLRLDFGGGARLGPGRADLLEAIGRTGSISAAGRDLGMSYKRAWTLVEALNATFAQPLVESARGGAQGGGARLTGAGLRVLELYRLVERRAAEASAAELAELGAMLGDMSGRK